MFAGVHLHLSTYAAAAAAPVLIAMLHLLLPLLMLL